MQASPFELEILFRLGPVEISDVVVITWVLMLVLTAISALATRKLEMRPGRLQAVLELIVDGIGSQIHAVAGRDPAPFVPLLGTLFIFLVCANLVGLLPGLQSPTAHLETPAALGIAIFLAGPIYGIYFQGLGGYLKSFVSPNFLMLPINIISEISRHFSLVVRLFGNMSSHELVLAILLSLAGFLLPVPFMALGVLIGVIQAYIFWILSTVFIGAAVRGEAA